MHYFPQLCVDRREAYYARRAHIITTDPLDFYCRVEKGLLLQRNFKWMRKVTKPSATILRLRRRA